MNEFQCLECEEQFDNKKKLSAHVFFKHKLSAEQYSVKFTYLGIRPSCKECGSDTLFVKGKNTFREYCSIHSNLARSQWSKNNGYGAKQDASWKKGLTKETHSGIKSQSEKISGENNVWHGKSLPQKTLELATLNRIEKLTLSKEIFEEQVSLLKNFTVLTKYEDYNNNYKQLLDVVCTNCGHEQKKTLWMIKTHAVCRKCTPYSNEEREVSQFIDSLGLISEKNDRKIISPLELDLYIPCKNFAIEYNGLYWHNIEHKQKLHHSNKTTLCREKGIQLFHIYSDEWQNKKEIVKSMLKNRMGITANKIHARKTIVKIINSKQANNFYSENHISGAIKSKINFGLFYNNELVTCLSFRSPRHISYKNTIEISRFASKLDTVVIGGFSKLFKQAIEWSKQNNYSTIMTYADLRFGLGKVYEKNGFTFIKNTDLDYWYTDNHIRYDRFKFRAKDGLSEKQVADYNKVTRIYGCGSALYEMVIK
jgi:hypothetical protein